MCFNCTTHISTAWDLHPGMCWVWSCYERLSQCCNLTELLCFEEQSHHSPFTSCQAFFLVPWLLFQHITDLLDYLCYKEFQTAMRFTAKCTRKHQYCRHLLVEKRLLPLYSGSFSFLQVFHLVEGGWESNFSRAAKQIGEVNTHIIFALACMV